MLALTLVHQILAPSPIPPPDFARYRTPVSAHGPLVPPRLATRQHQHFRTVLEQAISKGYGVVEGGTEHERVGPNFAGHFVLVQWGCGLSCMNAALLDSEDGTVLELPALPGRNAADSFRLLTCDDDLRSLRFHTDSRLLGIPNCPDGLTYYFDLRGHRWNYLGTTASGR